MNVSVITADNNYDEILQAQNTIAIIVPIFFGLIAIIGFFGNSLVILVVLLNSEMRSTTNLLIANLAVADLFFIVFCIPFTATDYITSIWPFGDAWCKIVQYLIVVTAHASIYTLVLMSIDRFLAVVYPITSRTIRTEKVTRIAIFSLWSSIFVISTPVAFAHGVEDFQIGNQTFATCQYLDDIFLPWPIFHMIFMTSSYFLPLLLITGLYVKMIKRLWNKMAGSVMLTESQHGRKRVTKLVITVVVAFASLWCPVQVILLLKSLNVYESDTLFKLGLQIFAQILAYTSSCINPLLYAFLSINFRRAFQKVIHSSSKYYQDKNSIETPRKSSYGRTSLTIL